MMNVNTQITKILNSPLLATSIFLTTGAAKTYSDYKQAEPEYKHKFLIKDTFVLSGAMAGMVVSKNLGGILHHFNFVKKQYDKLAVAVKNKLKLDKLQIKKLNSDKIQTPLNYAREIVKNTLINFSFFAFGITGALLADLGLRKCFLDLPELERKKKERHGINKLVDSEMNHLVGKENKKIIYSRLYDMPQMSMFAPGIIGKEALKLANEKNTKKKLNHTTGSLINNSLIPMFLLSASTVLTQQVRPFIRIPLIFASMIGGTKVVNILRNRMINKDENN